MSNPIAVCILVFCTVIFTTQIFLEYYLYISQVASDGSSNSDIKRTPSFIQTNIVTVEEV